jgi:hypothetical protein
VLAAASASLDVVVAGEVAGHLLGGPDRRPSQVVDSLAEAVLKGGGAPATLLLSRPVSLADVVAASSGLTSDACLAALLGLVIAGLKGGYAVPRVVGVAAEVVAAERRAQGVLRARTPSLLRLARALDGRGELTGREVADLLT